MSSSHSSPIPGSSAASVLTDDRANQLYAWALVQLQTVVKQPEQVSIRAMTGDASFRRYFRLFGEDNSWVLMDAPPEKESIAAFLSMAQRLDAVGLCVPQILASDTQLGCILMGDLGDELYRQRVDTQPAEVWWPEMLSVLAKLAADQGEGLPVYSEELLSAEMEEFADWYLDAHLQKPLNEKEQVVWQDLCKALLNSAAEQPQVLVHRDFISSNLLRTPDGQVGVIDFQDAVRGPQTYDLVSFLWDRYQTWPQEQLEAWIEQARLMLNPAVDAQTWLKQCEWMALQRNLKIVGRFCRLNYRDHKPSYLELMPRFRDYVQHTLQRYPEFAAFGAIMQDRWHES